jgi:hypothetical protein
LTCRLSPRLGYTSGRCHRLNAGFGGSDKERTDLAVAAIKGN